MGNLISRLTRSVLVAVLAASACLASAQIGPSAEQRMAGTWFGEFTAGPSATTQRFITTRRADGTFTLEARIYEGGKVVAEARNAGLWGISNGMYFTVTTEVNGQRSDPKLAEAINAYLVRTLEADRFDYVHVASGRHFSVRRVEPGQAKLPD